MVGISFLPGSTYLRRTEITFSTRAILKTSSSTEATASKNEGRKGTATLACRNRRRSISTRSASAHFFNGHNFNAVS